MNQPIEQRVAKLEQHLDNLEKQEREYSFTIRGIAHKATINLGIATAQEVDIKEIRVDIASIKATQSDHGEMLRSHGELLREILARLEPRQ